MLKGIPTPIKPKPSKFIDQYRLFLRSQSKAYSRKPTRVPTVFTHNKASAVIAKLGTPYILIAQ